MNLALGVDILVGGLIMGAIYALIAIGLNLQYGLMRILNVAHGEFLMIGAYLTYSLYTAAGVNPLLTLLITGPTAFIVGVVLHRLLYARVITGGEAVESLESRSILLSFGLLFVLQNGALLVWSADLRGYTYLGTPVSVLGALFPGNRLVAAALALLFSIGFYLFLKRSLLGKATRALMQDVQGAQLSGIDVSRIHAFCFGIGVAMSALTGSLISMILDFTPFIGLPFTVTALVVVILGGLGNILGSLLGGLLLGLIETSAVYLVASDIRVIASYAVLSLVLILKPAGLFGR
jgi:branched-chain amino acid transport system permease protein